MTISLNLLCTFFSYCKIHKTADMPTNLKHKCYITLYLV